MRVGRLVWIFRKFANILKCLISNWKVFEFRCKQIGTRKFDRQQFKLHINKMCAGCSKCVCCVPMYHSLLYFTLVWFALLFISIHFSQFLCSSLHVHLMFVISFRAAHTAHCKMRHIYFSSVQFSLFMEKFLAAHKSLCNGNKCAGKLYCN